MSLLPEPTDKVVATSLSRTDWIIAALMAVATIIFVAMHVPRPITPMEDASMLLRYSQNVARGQGIVWNVGEHPVEGATDFLYMVSIAAISWLTKTSVQSSAAGLLFVSQVVSVVVLYVGLRRLYDAPRLMAVGFAAALGAGMGYHYISSAFSPPFYSLFALLAWYAGMRCIQDGVTWQRAIWFGSIALVTGLIRPDGVLLAVFMLCSTLYGVRAKRLELVITFGTIFAIFGGAYFAWRWHYFGYLFPNPFYIKHQTTNQLANLKISARLLTEMLLPFLPLAGLGLISRQALRQLTVWLITVVPFTAVWVIISADNNHYSRFQYVMVPLSLMALGGLTAKWWREFEQQNRSNEIAAVRKSLVCVMMLLFVFAIFYSLHMYKVPFSNAGGQQLAERLRPYAGKNYTMVVTEAGDIPFYSEWRAIDTLGLNDAFIAHHGGVITEQYLDRYKPEVILYHDVGGAIKGADTEAAATGGIVTTKDLLTLNALVLRKYALKHGYVFAAKWGAESCNYHVYWVRPDFPDRDAIISAIRDYPYYAQGSGQLSLDFSHMPDPSLPCAVSAY